ncbi:lasso peptide biosynthesis B2 protein [Amycolatopsis sp. lyj-23]|uniref:lasso peptide biosynthesis B2 protein n=1 Tax=Amycolatopsis sp. lyj-23 TaxID=2789283 RepID=UPI00397CF468
MGQQPSARSEILGLLCATTRFHTTAGRWPRCCAAPHGPAPTGRWRWTGYGGPGPRRTGPSTRWPPPTPPAEPNGRPAPSAQRAIHAVRRAGLLAPGRVTCLEESAAVLVLLAASRQRVTWCHGASADQCGSTRGWRLTTDNR